MSKLTHIDKHGKARMVDVTAKEITTREAVAKGSVFMQSATLKALLANEIKKGDVLGVARIAGIMAAKKTCNIIPLCHPLNITSVDIFFEPQIKKRCIDITASVKVSSQTGVEMEALTAVFAAALTIYDMCKAIDKEMTISHIRLVKKTGGKSGTYVRTEAG
ncbi:MAG: cyclic pyranopterin monophosphate synthase MoaC [Deltaproteobacteria bacterium]|nr:cyclic pyranopterin monophosphate synthase MoaC [Deltaproteobacteria bacterium]